MAGRPSKYDTHVQPKLNLVESWARDGLTLEQIAHNLGVALSSLCEYKNQYSELAEAIKNGKDDIDVQVENALLKRALGYNYAEVTYENGIETKRVVKEVTPDTTAQIFWLKNRRPAAWRDKQDIEHSGTMTNKIDMSQLTVEELRRLAKSKSGTA